MQMWGRCTCRLSRQMLMAEFVSGVDTDDVGVGDVEAGVGVDDTDVG